MLASDGDLMEGIRRKRSRSRDISSFQRLIVLFDDNGISIDGPLSLSNSVDQVKRFGAAGWATRIDGHDPQAVAARARAGEDADRPT
jgi:transketolase